MYTVIVDMQRVVNERYVVELEADDPEEALDAAYEHFSTFPDSPILLDTRRRIVEQTVGVNLLNAEFERLDGSNDDDISA